MKNRANASTKRPAHPQWHAAIDIPGGAIGHGGAKGGYNVDIVSAGPTNAAVGLDRPRIGPRMNIVKE
jgi:hypothetical protein